MSRTTKKDFRELKMSSSYNGSKVIPMVRLQGLWLEELGFHSGDPILVKCEDGKLIITPDTERIEREAKEQEFIQKEMKALEKRFAEERKRIYEQVVAERAAYYRK